MLSNMFTAFLYNGYTIKPLHICMPGPSVNYDVQNIAFNSVLQMYHLPLTQGTQTNTRQYQSYKQRVVLLLNRAAS